MTTVSCDIGHSLVSPRTVTGCTVNFPPASRPQVPSLRPSRQQAWHSVPVRLALGPGSRPLGSAPERRRWAVTVPGGAAPWLER